jgi:enoyl-CoA hydratase/carnithine racemase
MGEELSLHHGVVAESFVYSTLQAGAEFHAWLEARNLPTERPPDDGDPVLVSRHGPDLDIELHRPSVRNALNAAMRDALIDAFTLVEVDRTIARARLRGSGPSFCSGGDLREFGTARDPATAHSVRVSRSVGLALARCADRINVEVHGSCVGAGIEIPAFSRRVTATSDATFRLPEVSFGLIPGAGGTVSLPRRIGRHRTTFAALTGEAISALTAQDWGLVDEVRD